MKELAMKHHARSLLAFVGLASLAACGVDRPSGALEAASANAIWDDPALRAEAVRLAPPLFARHCASCHGADLKGTPGAHVPDLTDDRWHR